MGHGDGVDFLEPGGAMSRRRWQSTFVMTSLAALAGPAAGQTPNPVLADVPENVALDLGTYASLCPVGADCDPTNTSYSGMVYDRDRHHMLVFGGGHAATYRDDVDVFDFTTLTWAPAYAPTPCAELTLDNVDAVHAKWISSGHPIARHTYDLLAMAGQPSELWVLSKVQGRGRGCTNLPPVTDDGTSPYVIASGTYAAYNPDTQQWRFSETPASEFETGAETDPVSGHILIVDRHRGICSADPTDGAFTCHAEVDPLAATDLRTGNGVSLVYFPPTDRFYAFALTRSPQALFEVHFDRDNPSASTLRQLVDVVPPASPVTEAWAYDDANQLIGGGVKDGRFFAFDPVAGQWHERIVESSNPEQLVGTVDGKALAYDPVDNVYIFRTNNASRRHTWAYRWGGEAPPVEPRPDAGPSPVDAGPGDGGQGQDGGEVGAADGGPTAADAGADADAGPLDERRLDPGDGSSGTGCNCRTASVAAPGWVLLALIWLARGRRR